MTTTLYIEGAAQNNDLGRTRCRQAFHIFFKTAEVTKSPRIIACGGRQRAYEMFTDAVNSAKPNDLALLLVDAEDALAANASNWQHLKDHDCWDRPMGADDNQVFLMVQVMEAWFLADAEALHRFFGSNFSHRPLKTWPALEAIPKHTIYQALEKATVRCKHPYKKETGSGEVSFKILCSLDPGKVEAACPHAKSLLDRLRSL